MIYLFRIVSDEDPEFLRDVVADGSDTFLKLHQTLQDNLGYDACQLASFFITGEMWEKKQEITLIDMMQGQEHSFITMEQATLEEHISELSHRMIYVFDFFSERAFFIELIEKSDQVSTRDTPFIAKSEGSPPQQLAMDLFLENQDVNMDVYDPDNEEMDDLRLDDLDLDMSDYGMPEDY